MTVAVAEQACPEHGDSAGSATAPPPPDLEATAARLESEIAEVCGVVHAATARLVRLIGEVLATGTWSGAGIRSPEHWVAWQCGVSARRARRLVVMARRLGELPETGAAFDSGALSEDQAEVICRHAPATHDGSIATLARSASVGQLQHVLRRYCFEDEDAAATGSEPPEERTTAPGPEPARRVGFGYGPGGRWHLSADLEADEGALVDAALTEARRQLEAFGQPHTWADALVAVADGYLGAPGASRAHHERYLTLLHLEVGEPGPMARPHLGPPLPSALRRFATCDGRVRIVERCQGVALSVGRSQRLVPERTRLLVEDRDGGCRVPACGATRWLQIHHVVHWEDGGPTDTDNLVALCHRHHRAHHLGQLAITGQRPDGTAAHADRPDGILFTDAWGSPITARAAPVAAPPGDLGISGQWCHPSGERLDGRALWLAPAG